MSAPFEHPPFLLPTLSNENLTPQNNQCNRRPPVNEKNLPPKKVAKSTPSFTKSRTRTKTLKETEESQPNTLVTLPRDKLLTTGRQEFDSFIQSVTHGRKLTKEEKKEVSRQRKLIKNRNTAAASRKRKKDYQNQLEAQHDQLSQSQNQIKEKLAFLEAENQQMKKEISFFENLVRSNPIASSVWDQVKLAKKQISLASPSMILTAKYLLLFILLINMMFFCSISQATSNTSPFMNHSKKNVEWNYPNHNEIEQQFSSSYHTDSNSLMKKNNYQEDIFLPDLELNNDDMNVPTLMPPKDVPNIMENFDFQTQTASDEKESLNDLFDQSLTSPSTDFPVFTLDELLSGTNVNNTLALTDSEQSEFDFWGNSDSFFEALTSEPNAPLEPCRSASKMVTVPSPSKYYKH